MSLRIVGVNLHLLFERYLPRIWWRHVELAEGQMGPAHAFGVGGYSQPLFHSQRHAKTAEVRKTPQQCCPLCHASSEERWISATFLSHSLCLFIPCFGGWIVTYAQVQMKLLLQMSKCWATDECRLWQSQQGRTLTCERRATHHMIASVSLQSLQHLPILLVFFSAN